MQDFQVRRDGAGRVSGPTDSNLNAEARRRWQAALLRFAQAIDREIEFSLKFSARLQSQGLKLSALRDFYRPFEECGYRTAVRRVIDLAMESERALSILVEADKIAPVGPVLISTSATCYELTAARLERVFDWARAACRCETGEGAK